MLLVGNNDKQIGLDAMGYAHTNLVFLVNLQDTNLIIELLADTFTVAVTDSVGCQG